MNALSVGLAVILSTSWHPLAAQQPARWTLDLELRIGREDAPEYALTSSRVLAVADDGTMFLAQPRDPAIRVFDVNGKFVRSIGRRGQGPGEFTSLSRIGLRGDTLWASDRERLHLFTRSGQLIRTVVVRYQMERADLMPGPVNAILRDGTLGTSPAFALNRDPAAWPSGLPLLRLNRNSGVIEDTLALLDFGFMGFYRWNGLIEVATRAFYPTFPHAFTPDGGAVIVVRHRAAERAQPTTFTLTRLGITGDTLMTRQISYQPVAVSAQARDSVRASLGAGSHDAFPRERVEAQLRGIPTPAFYPPVLSLAAANDGTTWLRLQGTTPAEWLVVSPAGDVSARVRGQASLAILAVDGNRVWGLERDELDVPTLVRYRINRSPNSAR